MRKQLLTVAGAVALALSAGTASAFSVGTIVQGAGVGQNNGVSAIYGGAGSASGFFGANWALVGGSANISVTFLGREAGWDNKFEFGSVSAQNFSYADNTFSAVGSLVGTLNGVLPGLLNFKFTTPGGATAVNGTNPDNTINDLSVNFFSRISDAACDPLAANPCYGGQQLDLWFDDLGGGPDDNHDDMVIRLRIENGTFNVVPIPAALPLLLSGLAGLGFVARRRKVA